MKLFAKAPTSVSEILSDFHTKVDQLLNLAESKDSEVESLEQQITQLQSSKTDATQEASAARVAAERIRSFFG